MDVDAQNLNKKDQKVIQVNQSTNREDSVAYIKVIRSNLKIHYLANCLSTWGCHKEVF